MVARKRDFRKVIEGEVPYTSRWPFFRRRQGGEGELLSRWECTVDVGGIGGEKIAEAMRASASRVADSFWCNSISRSNISSGSSNRSSVTFAFDSFFAGHSACAALRLVQWNEVRLFRCTLFAFTNLNRISLPAIGNSQASLTVQV
ncbi:hypothetical protein Tcan_04573 [Toxocara canis]|uniref:Uncharacterized protein n=1 Tax=Toxocara canis TaxID=6265 RepID=A0A0B2V740_TOXCA|nr:hypothetical protein Tcan_04573 [Toxocara canis]